MRLTAWYITCDRQRPCLFVIKLTEGDCNVSIAYHSWEGYYGDVRHLTAQISDNREQVAQLPPLITKIVADPAWLPPSHHTAPLFNYGAWALVAGIRLFPRDPPVGVKGRSGIAPTGDLPHGL
jgi:hypothetical protein